MQKTILITDDQPHMLNVLEFSLADTGCRFETAGSGEEALLKAATGPIDLLVIDVKLPGIDGIETVRRAAQNAWLRRTASHRAHRQRTQRV